jgi:hypothetical protein
VAWQLLAALVQAVVVGLITACRDLGAIRDGIRLALSRHVSRFIVATIISSLLSTSARAQVDADGRICVTGNVTVMPHLSLPAVPVSGQGTGQLTPRIAGTVEVGAYMFYVLPVIPYVQLGPTLYLIPPRSGTIAPFVSLKAGAGFWWLCIDCTGEDSFQWLVVGTASAGIEIPTIRLGRGSARLILTGEAGRTWVGTGQTSLIGEKETALYFGRIGVGVRL